MMQATLRPVDDSRALRLLAAWHDEDKLALDAVLAEAGADPVGAAGMLFALLAYASRIGEQTLPDYRAQVAAWLLQNASDGRGK